MSYFRELSGLLTDLENRILNKLTGRILPTITSADEGKVATVDSSGEWAAEMPSGLVIATASVANSAPRQIR